MIASLDLTDICQQLVRDAGGRKVLLCSVEGEVLAHAGAEGSSGSLDEATGDAVAQLIADVVEGAADGGRVPATKDLVASLPGGLPGGLSACATAVGAKAALVVIFDGRATTLDRVRLKVRRAREVLGKSLPAEPSAEKPSSH
ncbi:MAG: hypothetical protein JWN44_3871 [Myxococcales bacterium]|nr:hypothetical protein [Myxococcales bacterium]